MIEHTDQSLSHAMTVLIWKGTRTQVEQKLN
jgi:hypothetical protein